MCVLSLSLHRGAHVLGISSSSCPSYSSRSIVLECRLGLGPVLACWVLHGHAERGQLYRHQRPEAVSAALQVSLMLTDDAPQDPELVGPEVRPRFQSDYEDQREGTSAPEPAAAVVKRSRGRPAKTGKWQVWPRPHHSATASTDLPIQSDPG